jgi:hypothetical protein
LIQTEAMSDDPRLPVPIGDSSPKRERARRTFTDFAAHLLGQRERRRGLKGGPETLDAARRTYLSTEYSGNADRRPAAGRLTKTEV